MISSLVLCMFGWGSNLQSVGGGCKGHQHQHELMGVEHGSARVNSPQPVIHGPGLPFIRQVQHLAGAHGHAAAGGASTGLGVGHRFYIGSTSEDSVHVSRRRE